MVGQEPEEDEHVLVVGSGAGAAAVAALLGTIAVGRAEAVEASRGRAVVVVVGLVSRIEALFDEMRDGDEPPLILAVIPRLLWPYAIDAGADDMLCDPPDPVELSLRVRLLCRLHRAQQPSTTFRDILARAPIPVAVLRGEEVLFVNDAFARSLDRSIDGILEGGYPVVRDDAERFRRACGRAQRGAAECLEVRLRGRDGVVSHKSALLGIEFEGRPAVVSLDHDITETRLIQSRLAQTDRMVSTGRLVAGVAHEINNPLTYVLSNIEYLRKHLREPGRVDREELVHVAEDASEGAARVRDIVFDLKAFAREDQPESGVVDVNVAVRSALKMLRNELKYRARVVLDLGQVAPVWGSAGKLGQVVLNLILNGVEALDDIGAGEKVIEVTTRMEGGSVLVEIADSGPGIPSARLPHLFEPFFTTKPAGRGTGLGLWICHSIVAAHDGKIDVQSGDRGMVFQVHLPPTHAPTREAQQPAVTPPALRSGRLLVVDDEARIRKVLTQILRPRYDVVAAGSGDEAIQLMRKSQFDAVVCDLMMREGTGMDCFAWASAHAPDLAKRMIFVTGGALNSSAENFIARHASQVLPKPFEPDDVLDRVQAVLALAPASGATAARAGHAPTSPG